MPGSGVVGLGRAEAYRYLTESAVTGDDDHPKIALSTCGGASTNPYFLSGFVSRPRLAAGALLSIAKISGSRFYTPTAMRDAAIRAADPVVTSDGHRLRFESFSLCGGVYCRADFLGGSLDDGFVSAGTTNVDFNSAMRSKLSLLRDTEAAHLDVGADRVVLSTTRDRLVERKVPLAERWLRGFAEVQIAQTKMVPRVELGPASTKRFLSSVARTRGRGVWWATPGESGMTVHAAPSGSSIRIAGIERMRLLADHARHAIALRGWSTDGESPSTAWELELPDLRLTIVLSPDIERGFSGEGAALFDLSDDPALDVAEWIHHHIDPGQDLDVVDLADRLRLDTETVRRSLTSLAATGSAGYDLTEGKFFHRQLPFDRDALAGLQPRLRHARALAEDSVAVISDREGILTAVVRGVHGTYIAQIHPVGWTCTCPWYGQHRQERGPCKHVLAVKQVARSV